MYSLSHLSGALGWAGRAATHFHHLQKFCGSLRPTFQFTDLPSITLNLSAAFHPATEFSVYAFYVWTFSLVLRKFLFLAYISKLLLCFSLNLWKTSFWLSLFSYLKSSDVFLLSVVSTSSHSLDECWNFSSTTHTAFDFTFGNSWVPAWRIWSCFCRSTESFQSVPYYNTYLP